MLAAKKPLEAFAGAAEKTQSRLSRVSSSILKYAGAITAASLAIGAVHLMKSSAETIDQMGKLSDRLNVSTEDLAGLKLAADLSGVSFEGLTTDMEKLTKGLGDPSNEMQKSLAMLGLTADKLKGLGAGGQLRVIADAFANIASSEQRAAIAADLFGKQGQALLPFLAMGSKGLDDSAKAAKELGASFSRVDAKAVEEANDAVTRLTTAFKGLGNQLAITFSGAIETVVNHLTARMKELMVVIEAARTVAFNLGISGQEKVAGPDPIAQQMGQDAFDAGVSRGFSDDRQMAASLADEIFAKQRDSTLKGVHDSMMMGPEWDRFADDMQRIQDTGAQQLKDYHSQQSALHDVHESMLPGFEFDTLMTHAAQQSSVAAVADRGTRGTYAGETAGRTVGAASIPQKQLDTLKSIDQKLDTLNDTVTGGLPVG